MFPKVYFLTAIFCLLAFGDKVCAVDEVMSILESVPVNQREGFIKYYYQKGYELSTNNQERHSLKSSSNLNDDFALKLYEFFQNRDVICFEDGTCIDPNDPGIYPTQ